MDALNNYDLEELGKIEHEHEVDTYESDDAALNNLDDIELATLLEAEQGNWAEDGVPHSQSVSHTSGSSLGVIIDDIEDDFGNNKLNDSLEGMMDKNLELEEALQLHKYRELKAARLVVESSAKALLLKPIATKKSTISRVQQRNHKSKCPGWIDSDIIPKQEKSNIRINTICHSNPHIMAQPPGGYTGWTNLNYDAQDTSWSNLLLNSQDEHVKKALLKAAMHLKTNEMVDCLSDDAEYGMVLSGLSKVLSRLQGTLQRPPYLKPLTALASTLHLCLLQHVPVPIWYLLVVWLVLLFNTVTCLDTWLKELVYIHCGDVANDLKCFFTVPASIGTQLLSKFKSSCSDRANEKEIPILMLALVATSVYATIKEWECGPHIKANFGSNIFENTYR
ncbi:hypothetical protein F5148DRAFT_1296345 [Russula earlei]|uniref:Uncharacterized protein n=1 Tax=Russula earlei TaxID=71964 RepID=A0ACC0TR35_9AGAM|nr:hypothetical protein F5148DRAFT_1296345 [Russula earlei]